MRTLWIALAGLGCSDLKSGSNNETTCDTSNLDDNAGAALITTTDWWTPTGYWAWSGTSLQIILDQHIDWQMTLFASRTVDGDEVKDVLMAGAGPIEISLDEATGGGNASVRHDLGNMTSAASYSGTLYIDALQGNQLTACWDFQATGTAGTLNVTEGVAQIDAM
jgi:hypothetical protein